MSHDQGLPWARHHSSSKPSAEPALGRPSLFAGMESDEEDSSERVRILSTLAANRPPSKRASTRARARRGRTSSWQVKALMGLMGLGVAGLLAGFAMVLTQGHPQAQPDELPEVRQTAMPTPPAAAASAVAATAASAPATTVPAPTALIEDLAPTAATTSTAVAATSPLAALNTAQATPSSAPAQPAPKAPESDPQGKPAGAPVIAAATVEVQPKHTLPRPSTQSHAQARKRSATTKPSRDADVALLEAMFTHGQSGTPTKSKQRPCSQRSQDANCRPSR